MDQFRLFKIVGRGSLQLDKTSRRGSIQPHAMQQERESLCNVAAAGQLDAQGYSWNFLWAKNEGDPAARALVCYDQLTSAWPISGLIIEQQRLLLFNTGCPAATLTSKAWTG